MAEIQKPLEVVPVETAPVEVKPVEETPAVAETAPVLEADKPAEEVKPAEATEEAEAAKEEPKEEVKPVEEGSLSHKAQGLSFPKNLIPSKEFFFFGTDAYEPKSLSSYQKGEKSTETAQSNIAWASETGKGLLFVGDKKTPSSIISLADASEPEVDGSNKFTLTSKGNKHSFKAATTAERDNWVSQLKLKIAEAKELSATVTESEKFKATVESFKPAPLAKKEEKVAPVEAPKEEAKTEETPATEATPAEAAPVEEAAAVKEEPKVEEPKRRSASRKRASFFGFGKKDEKKEEAKVEETPAAESAPVIEDAAVVPAPVVEDATIVPAPVVPAEETAVTDAAPAEAAPVEEATPAESPKDKSSKRNSFFGGVFSKKEKKAAETKPAEATDAPKEGETVPAAEDAPVIPPVEATTPLAVDVSSPATVPTETTDITPATNGEAKKDTKEKRKSSLPFAFGKREKSPAPVEGEAKSSPFSKFRATIKGKSSAAKTEETPKEEAKTEETPAEEAAKVEEPVTVEPEVENKPETVATTTPAVTAAA